MSRYMTVGQLIEQLQGFDENARVFIGSGQDRTPPRYDIAEVIETEVDEDRQEENYGVNLPYEYEVHIIEGSNPRDVSPYVPGAARGR